MHFLVEIFSFLLYFVDERSISLPTPTIVPRTQDEVKGHGDGEGSATAGAEHERTQSKDELRRTVQSKSPQTDQPIQAVQQPQQLIPVTDGADSGIGSDSPKAQLPPQQQQNNTQHIQHVQLEEGAEANLATIEHQQKTAAEEGKEGGEVRGGMGQGQKGTKFWLKKEVKLGRRLNQLIRIV